MNLGLPCSKRWGNSLSGRGGQTSFGSSPHLWFGRFLSQFVLNKRCAVGSLFLLAGKQRRRGHC